MSRRVLGVSDSMVLAQIRYPFRSSELITFFPVLLILCSEAAILGESSEIIIMIKMAR